MFAHERQEQITAKVSQLGQVSVQELAELFDVTSETVRRDLDALELAGSLRRIHGGAVSIDRLSLSEPTLGERQLSHPAEKLRIAQAALKYVPTSPDSSVLLDAGTTTELLADQAAGSAALFITNAIPIAHRLSQSPATNLELLGGRVRGVTSAAVGPRVTSALQNLRADVAFIGANGVHGHFGFSTPDSLEAAVKTAMIASAHQVIALVDSSKLGQETLVSFAPLNAVDVLITDQQPPAALAQALADADVELVIA